MHATVRTPHLCPSRQPEGSPMISTMGCGHSRFKDVTGVAPNKKDIFISVEPKTAPSTPIVEKPRLRHEIQLDFGIKSNRVSETHIVSEDETEQQIITVRRVLHEEGNLDWLKPSTGDGERAIESKEQSHCVALPEESKENYKNILETNDRNKGLSALEQSPRAIIECSGREIQHLFDRDVAGNERIDALDDIMIGPTCLEGATLYVLSEATAIEQELDKNIDGGLGNKVHVGNPHTSRRQGVFDSQENLNPHNTSDRPDTRLQNVTSNDTTLDQRKYSVESVVSNSTRKSSGTRKSGRSSRCSKAPDWIYYPDNDQSRKTQKNSPRASRKREKHEARHRFHKLLNCDPWEDDSWNSDDDALNMIKSHPRYCSKRFEVEAFTGKVYPLAMFCALGASSNVIQTCHEAYPHAILTEDEIVGLPIHFACSYKAPLAVLEYLIRMERKSLLRLNKFGRLPLHMACLFRPSVPVIEMLLAHCADAVEQPDSKGMTPLHLACDNKESPVEVIDLLIDAFPNATTMPSSDGSFPLHIAVSRPDADVAIVRKLIEAQSSALEHLDDLGRLPIHVAIANNAGTSIIEALALAFPLGRNARTLSGKETPFDIARRMARCSKVMSILLPE